MSPSLVTLVLDVYNGSAEQVANGFALLTPTTQIDASDEMLVVPDPIVAAFHVSGPPQVDLIPTDNTDFLPAGWAWSITFSGNTGRLPFTFFLDSELGTPQNLSAQAPVFDVTTMAAYLPLPSGTPAEGDVPTATGTGEATTWQAGGGGGGGGSVDSVTAADTSVVVAGTSSAPTVRTGTLDVIATQHPPAASWSNNSKKITSLANGALAQDAVAFGQLGSAAFAATSVFDAAGAAATALATAESFATSAVGTETTRAQTAEALALPESGGTMTGWLAPAVVALTQSAGAVAVNAALGNVFTLSLTASGWTISNPTNPVDGQIIRFRLIQDATGSRTISWGTAYDWGTTAGSANSAPTLTTTASKRDTVAFEYDAAISKWVSLGAPFPQGF